MTAGMDDVATARGCHLLARQLDLNLFGVPWPCDQAGSSDGRNQDHEFAHWNPPSRRITHAIKRSSGNHPTPTLGQVPPRPVPALRADGPHSCPDPHARPDPHALVLTPTPTLPLAKGRSRPSSTGYGEGAHRPSCTVCCKFSWRWRWCCRCRERACGSYRPAAR
jgi:hypothetical protein